MFIRDNGKVCVLAMTRCGHTSMTGYFGFEPHIHSWGDWKKIWRVTQSRRILVLRNPIHRCISASGLLEKNIVLPEQYTKEEWFEIHSRPYLKFIPKTLPFDIIPFENLLQYIPTHHRTIPTWTESGRHVDVVMTPELRDEYNLYRYFREYCNVISPEEWKELTENS